MSQITRSYGVYILRNWQKIYEKRHILHYGPFFSTGARWNIFKTTFLWYVRGPLKNPIITLDNIKLLEYIPFQQTVW